ncbi:hypothetical protein [Rhodococcus koreensis]
MKRTFAAVGATALLALTGCSTTSAPAAAPPETTTAAPTTTAARTTSNNSTPEPLGSELSFSGTGVAARVTVFAVNQDVAPNAPTPPSGGHWVGADLQTCVDESDVNFTVSWNGWSVTDARNGAYEASSLTYSAFPTPKYPFGSTAVSVGECVRGWVLFPVQDGVGITAVKYKPSSKVTAVWSAT